MAFEILVAGVGFEPTTFWLWARRATRLLYPAMVLVILLLTKQKVKPLREVAAKFGLLRFDFDISRASIFGIRW